MLGKLLVCAVILQVVLCRPQSEDEGRIVGGEQVAIDRYPYQVGVEFPDSANPDEANTCGGALIADNIVLTAAHCTQWTSEELAKGEVRVGSANFWNGGQKLKIIQVVDHKQYNKNTDENDLSLLKLESAVKLGSTVQIIPIATYARKSGVMVKVAGWGMTDPKKEDSGVDDLRAIEYPLIDAKDCRKSSHGNLITNDMICAGYIDRAGTSTCEGDSGGPLVHDGEVVGILSFGDEICAEKNSPDVFADVFKFSKWINDEVAILRRN